MGGIMAVIGDSRAGDPDFLEKLASLKGALIIAGLVYAVFALIIKLVGYEKVNKVLPPIVTGTGHYRHRTETELLCQSTMRFM